MASQMENFAAIVGAVAAERDRAIERAEEVEARLAAALEIVERYKRARSCNHCAEAAVVLRASDKGAAVPE